MQAIPTVVYIPGSLPNNTDTQAMSHFLPTIHTVPLRLTHLVIKYVKHDKKQHTMGGFCVLNQC